MRFTFAFQELLVGIAYQSDIPTPSTRAFDRRYICGIISCLRSMQIESRDVAGHQLARAARWQLLLASELFLSDRHTST